MIDKVNHPSHYIKGKYETIQIIEDVAQFYPASEAVLIGNIIRYISRAPHKGSKEEDLKKARWYLNRLIRRQRKQSLKAIVDGRK